jgi:hypothetical protein
MAGERQLSQEELADAAIDSLHAAVRAVKDLASASSSSLQPAAVQQCQQAYLQHTRSLRSRLQELKQLAQQQEEQATQQAGRHHRCFASICPCSIFSSLTKFIRSFACAEDPEQLQALRAREADLRAQIGRQAELEKALIDQLRGMLDAMTLWESYKKQLDSVAAGSK